ncbi:MAG: Gfo/Idh/MocA family protein [Bacteroidota bacterium]
MRVGIVGLALSHPYAFANLAIQEGETIAAIWDQSPEKREELAARLGARAVDDPALMLPGREAAVDAVLVCTKSGQHARYALPFLEAGVPTFVDKALATNVEDALALLEAGSRPGRLLMSTSAIRYAPSHVALREQVLGGRLGKMVWAEALVAHDIKGYLEGFSTWQDSVPEGGGSIVNMGIHGVEPLVSVWGGDVESIFCQASRLIYTQSQSEDTAVIQIRYKDGRLASVQILCSSNVHGYHLRVQGEKGFLAAAAPSGVLMGLNGAWSGNGDGNVEYGYKETVHRFLEGVRRGEAPIPLTETAAVIAILLAARLSAAEGRPVSRAEIGL